MLRNLLVALGIACAQCAYCQQVFNTDDHIVADVKTCGYRTAGHVSFTATTAAGDDAKATTTTTTIKTTTGGDELCAPAKAQLLVSLTDGDTMLVTFKRLDGLKPDDKGMVALDGRYVVAQDEIRRVPHHLWGWDNGGMLAVPVKYVIGKSFQPGGSLGPYIGYRFDQGTWSAHAVLSAGMTLATGDKGTSSDGTKSGFYVATGLIFKILDKMQVGLLVGDDFVSGYMYNRKPWISFAIGAEFAQ